MPAKLPWRGKNSDDNISLAQKDLLSDFIFAVSVVIRTSLDANVLAGGASRSLRTDAQGKTLGQAILEMKFTITKRDWMRLKLPVKSRPIPRG